MNKSDKGYLIMPRPERREMASTGEALASAELVRAKASARHVLRIPEVRVLAADPALIALAATFLTSTGASA